MATEVYSLDFVPIGQSLSRSVAFPDYSVRLFFYQGEGSSQVVPGIGVTGPDPKCFFEVGDRLLEPPLRCQANAQAVVDLG